MLLSRWSQGSTAIGAAFALFAASAACSGDRDAAPETASDDEQVPAAGAEAAGDEPDEGEPEAPATATPGELAPTFTLPGSDGQEYSLEEFRGQWVILEWVNHECPFVVKFYGAGKMQELQATYTDPEVAGAAWFKIASSGEGQQGYEPAERWNEIIDEKEVSATAVLLDVEGTVGKLYEARTTPQMVIIDPEGTLVYNGAIDDNPSRDPADIPDAENYVEAVMTAVLAGEESPYQYRDPYGCSIKYGPAT